MNERELRIGNYVIANLSTGDWLTYQVRSCDFSISCAGTLVCESFKPLPLTEEWLLKFGFEKEKFSTDEYDCSYTMYSFGAFYKKEDYFLPKPYYFSDAFGDNFKLRYVHQLQNLYFALTEDELELKK